MACGVDLQGEVARAIWDVDRHADRLVRQRGELVQRLRATAPRAPVAASPGPSPPSPPPPPPSSPARPPGRPPGITAMNAQALLGLAGAALVAVAAIVFAAVAWEALGPEARVLVLLGGSVASAVGAVALTRRALDVTGAALGGLSAVVAAIAVTSARANDAFGLDVLSGPGAGSLAAVAATIVGLVLGGRAASSVGPVRGSLVVASLGWVAALSFAVVEVAEVEAVQAHRAIAPAGLVAAAAIWEARRVMGRTPVLVSGALVWLVVVGIVGSVEVATAPVAVAGAAGLATVLAALGWQVLAATGVGAPLATSAGMATVSGLLVATAHRVVPDDAVGLSAAGVLALLLAVAVVRWRPGAGGAEVSATPRAGTRRALVLAGTVPATVPALAVGITAVGGATSALLLQAATPWREVAVPVAFGPGGGSAAVAGSAVVVLLAVGVLVVVPGRPARAGAVGLGALLVIASPVLWHLDVDAVGLWAAAVVVAALVVVLTAMRPAGPGRPVLLAVVPVVVLAAVGWLAADPWWTTVGALVALAVAVFVRAVPVPADGRAGEDVLRPWLVGTGGVVGTLAVGIAATSASVAMGLAPGPTAVSASAGIAAAAWLLVGAARPVLVATLVGAHTVVVAVALAAGPAGSAALAGMAAAVSLAVLAVRTDGVASTVATWSAMVHVTLANAIVMGDRDVAVVEAYTLLPAVLLLAVGGLRMRDEQVSSWVALAPGLVVATVPTALALLDDPSHLARALGAGAAGAALLAVAVGRRLAAPLVAGLVLVAAVVVSQGAAVAQLLPRWVAFAVLGVALLLLSATYERRLRDVRSLAERLRTYR